MSDLSHIDDAGKARMVDVSDKPESQRVARATGSIVMQRTTLESIRGNELAKGDVLGVARIAGVMAAKRTPEIVPLCHPILISDVQVNMELDDALPGVRVESIVRSTGRTGVEMEAMLCTAAALLTVYDMAKAVDRGMIISDIALQEKAGGKSGEWHR